MAQELKRAAVAGVFAISVTFAVIGQGAAGAVVGASDQVGVGPAELISHSFEGFAGGLRNQARASIVQAESNLDQVLIVARQPILLFEHPTPLLVGRG